MEAEPQGVYDLTLTGASHGRVHKRVDSTTLPGMGTRYAFQGEGIALKGSTGRL